MQKQQKSSKSQKKFIKTSKKQKKSKKNPKKFIKKSKSIFKLSMCVYVVLRSATLSRFT